MTKDMHAIKCILSLTKQITELDMMLRPRTSTKVKLTQPQATDRSRKKNASPASFDRK